MSVNCKRGFMLLLLAVLQLLAASGWAQPLASLPVHGEITIPAKPYYFGSHQGLAGVFGALGGIIAAPAVEDSRDRIKLYMEKHGIDIPPPRGAAEEPR